MNEASSVSQLEVPTTPPPQMSNADLAKELAKKMSMSFNNMRSSVQPTVVVRSPKSRPSLVSLDKGVMELTAEVSPSTSGETSGNSAGKQSGPARTTNSTGMTSLDSKFSAGMKMLSGHSSNTESKKALVAKQLLAEETTVNNSLTPISEVVHEIVIAPVAIPSKSLRNPLLSCGGSMSGYTNTARGTPSDVC